jgi:phosphoesterase RecJ-like protein
MIEKEVIQSILDKINASEQFVITAHKSPDGDSIGSSLALYHFLLAKGKQVIICHPDPCPNYLKWLDGVDLIKHFDSQPDEVEASILKSDVVFALDYNHPSRVGGMQQLLLNAGSKTIMIDHHLHPSDFASIIYSDSSVCSTAQMVFEVINADGTIAISKSIGEPIYLGIMTDTGSFRFSSVTPRTHVILAELLSNNIDHTKIHEAIYDQNSLNQLKLKSFAINQKLELLQNDSVALIYLTENELTQYKYEKGDTEGLVNTALSISGVKMAVLMVEKDNAIKMSFRSKLNLHVNQLASDLFEGGGHAYAAGGISYLSMEETINKLKDALPKYI